MFGHGEKGCNVTVRCASCAQKHKTIDCTTNKIQCANCGESHKATDPTCPTRSEYIEMIQKISTKTDRSPQQNNIKPIDNGNNFPHLNNRRFTPINTQTASPRSSDRANNYNNNVRGNNSQTGFWHNNNNNYNSAQGNPHNNNNLSLFSQEEFMELTMEMISKLSSCKTREQQFGVITQLAFKFVYCNVK